MTATPFLRLNWGCGGAGEPGWINSDRRAGPGIDLHCDILKGLPLESDTLDYVVSIHALQEIPFPDLLPVLQELRRVLKPGGVLRLCLPDLDKAIGAYLRRDRSYFLVPDSDAQSLGGKLIVHVLWYSYSRIMFTADFMQELLQRAGFNRVSPCRYQQSSSGLSGITELDNRPEESLFVEARK